MKVYKNEKHLADLEMFEQLITRMNRDTIYQVIQRVPNGFVLHSYDENGNTSVFIPVDDYQMFALANKGEQIIDGVMQAVNDITNEFENIKNKYKDN